MDGWAEGAFEDLDFGALDFGALLLGALANEAAREAVAAALFHRCTTIVTTKADASTAPNASVAWKNLTKLKVGKLRE